MEVFTSLYANVVAVLAANTTVFAALLLPPDEASMRPVVTQAAHTLGIDPAHMRVEHAAGGRLQADLPARKMCYDMILEQEHADGVRRKDRHFSTYLRPSIASGLVQDDDFSTEPSLDGAPAAAPAKAEKKSSTSWLGGVGHVQA